MIDLRNKGLPLTIKVGERFFKLKTDFREWIKFGEVLKGKFDLTDLFFVIDEELTLLDCAIYGDSIVKELLNFYTNQNATPKQTENDNGEEIIDYVLDGDYIYSSYLAQYGIDLVDIEYLHWHKFKALFLGLNDGSKIKQIMSFRNYKKSNKKEEEVRKELKEIWKLPKKENENQDEIMEEINNEFYNS